MRRTILLVASMALTFLVASGVALAVTKIGTDGSDFIVGTKGSDVLSGKGGSDWINGRAGNDVIKGGPGNDGPTSRAIGQLNGGLGADVIKGGPGRDGLVDGPFLYDSAVDILDGGDGGDFLTAWSLPAARDIVNCGAGKDQAVVDRKDIVGDDCERIFYP